MFISSWMVKYIVIWSLVFWPLHALGVRNGIAFAIAFAAWIPAFEIFRRRRRRRFYEQVAMQMEQERPDCSVEDGDDA